MDAAPPPPLRDPPGEPLVSVAIRTTLLLFVTFLTLGVLLQLAHPPLGMWLTELLIFLALPAVILRRSGRAPFRTPMLTWTGPGPLLMGFLLGTLNFFAFVAPVQMMILRLVPESVREAFDGARVFEDLAPWELKVVLAAVTLAAPFCEEYFFRGVLQQGLQRTRLRPAVAVLITATIFSAFHLDPVGFVGRLELGLLFGLLFLRTGSLWPAIGAHLANNAVSSALFLAGKDSAAEASAAALPEASAVATIAGAGGLLLAALLWTLRESPALLPARALPEEGPALPRLGLAQTWGAWFLAVALGLALLVTTQWTAMRIHAFDFSHPLPPEAERSDAEKLAIEELEKMRIRARRGEVSLERYQEARRQVAEE